MHHLSRLAQRAACVFTRFLFLLGLLCNTLSLQAAEKTISQKTYKQLTTIHEHIDGQRYSEAVQELKALLKSVENRPYEKAVALQSLGYVYASQEKYPLAIAAFESSLAQDELPQTIQQQLRYSLAQLYASVEKYDRSIEILEHWFSLADKPGAEAYLLLGQVYAQAGQHRQAIVPLTTAIDLADQPRANWYESLLAMYYETRAYRESATLLKKMIRLFPERNRYWQQLASVYLSLNHHNEALTVLELAYRDGILIKEKDLLQLAQLYLYTGIPYKAARFLENQMKTGKIRGTAKHRRLLVQAWDAAQERTEAINALEGMVASTGNAKDRLRLAQWYLEVERWQDAENILHPVVTSSQQEKFLAHAWMLLGIANYEQGKTIQAKRAFTRAGLMADTRETAQQWLQYLESLAS